MVHPGKSTLWTPTSWRFGSDVFSFQFGWLFRWTILIFRGVFHKRDSWIYPSTNLEVKSRFDIGRWFDSQSVNMWCQKMLPFFNQSHRWWIGRVARKIKEVLLKEGIPSGNNHISQQIEKRKIIDSKSAKLTVGDMWSFPGGYIKPPHKKVKIHQHPPRRHPKSCYYQFPSRKSQRWS